MEMKFYKCDVCGQIITKVKDTKMPLICCSHEMKEIPPKETKEGLDEKHIPVFKIKKNKAVVYIGQIMHPSTEDHHIEWIALKTNKGNQRKNLKPGDYPEACFYISDNEVIEAIYAYCNLHSLWVLKVENGCNKSKCGCGCSCKSFSK